MALNQVLCGVKPVTLPGPWHRPAVSARFDVLRLIQNKMWICMGFADYEVLVGGKGSLWNVLTSGLGNQTMMWGSLDWCTDQRNINMVCCLPPITAASTCASGVWNSSCHMTYGGCTHTTSCQAETECLHGTTRRSVPVSIMFKL